MSPVTESLSRMVSRKMIVFLILIAPGSQAFVIPSQARNVLSLSRTFVMVEYDDFAGYGKDTLSEEGGRALAKEFYGELENRTAASTAAAKQSGVKMEGLRPSSPGFFVRGSGSVYSGAPTLMSSSSSSSTVPNPEYTSLLGNVERNMRLQAAAIAAFVLLIICVELSGGLTSGADRFGDMDLNEMAESMSIFGAIENTVDIDVVRKTLDGTVLI